MKQLYALLLAAGSMAAHAQTYVPFPTSNTTWTERLGRNDNSPGFRMLGLKNADTVIGGVTYHKLYQSPDAVLDESEWIGGLRENAAHKVYFYNNSTHTETVIYDFSVAVADTVITQGSMQGIVHSIDSVLIGGSYRMRINFRMPGSSAMWLGGSWVAGMGNTGVGGLLGSPLAQPTCDCATEIICAQQTGSWNYHNSKYGSLDCTNVLGTEVLHTDAIHADIYPNPITNTSTLSITGNAGFDQVSIYDMQGRKVKTLAVVVGGTILSKSDYAPGVYVYRLQNSAGETLAGKFMVE
jgi:hypothetical protein